MPPPARLAIRAIRDDDQFKHLSLGHADFVPLKTFLKSDALDYEKCCVARTQVLVDAEHLSEGSRVWGYITLVASEVEAIANSLPPAKRWNASYRVPAVKIARMAIDQELQGQDFGRELVSFAVALVKDQVVPHIGCRLLVTDSKKSAVGFYSKLGFTTLDTESNKTRSTPVMFMKLDGLD